MRFFVITILYTDMLENSDVPHEEHEQYCSCDHEPDPEQVKSIFHQMDDFSEKKYVGYRIEEISEGEFDQHEDTISFP